MSPKTTFIVVCILALIAWGSVWCRHSEKSEPANKTLEVRGEFIGHDSLPSAKTGERNVFIGNSPTAP